MSVQLVWVTFWYRWQRSQTVISFNRFHVRLINTNFRVWETSSIWYFDDSYLASVMHWSMHWSYSLCTIESRIHELLADYLLLYVTVWFCSGANVSHSLFLQRWSYENHCYFGIYYCRSLWQHAISLSLLGKSLYGLPCLYFSYSCTIVNTKVGMLLPWWPLKVLITDVAFGAEVAIQCRRTSRVSVNCH